MNRDRLATAGLLGAAVLAGLLFGPVFGLAALLPPLAVVAAAGYAAFEAARRWPRLVRWQLSLTAAGGLIGLVGTVLRPTTWHGLPTAETLRALGRGATGSWRLTLQTTWPAGTAPDVLLFVPLLVLLALLLGTAALHRLGARGVALLPSLAVAGLAQAYSAVTGGTAALAAVGYAVAAAAVLGSPARQPAGDPGPRSAARRARAAARMAVTAVVPTLAAALAAALALGAGSLAGRPPYALDRIPPVQLGSPVGNPLDEIAERLTRPQDEAFRVRTAAPVDRWQLVVLDRFDGAGWTPDTRYLRLGAELPPAGTTAGPLRRGEAEITLGEVSPWLPSQRGTTTVTGIEPLVDAATGTLVAPAPAAGATYQLGWAAPAVTAAELQDRPVDPAALGGPAGLPEVPPGVSDLAAAAVRDRQASVGTALVLAQYLRTHYLLATGRTVPTGSGWVQLQRFLLQGGSGTSEQFATAYVVLARVLGIPARVVVGFRQPDRPEPDGTYVVRNGDILAWPEVAVQGAGWVPVDPMPERTDPGAARPAPLPPAPRPRPPSAARPPDEPADPAAADPGATGATDPPAAVVWAPAAGGVLLLVLLGWLAGVPVAKAVRRARRRRRAGPAAVAAAWLEARDQLRAHRVAASSAMTVRDLARAASASPGSAGPVAGGPAGRANGQAGGRAGSPAGGSVGGPAGSPAGGPAGGSVGGPAGSSPAGSPAGGPAGPGAQDGLRRLAEAVDVAAWSGGSVEEALVDEAWAAVGAVRRDLAGGPLPARVRAAVEVRSLLPPR